MNIAFFLTPKRNIVYLTTDETMAQVLEKMESNTYTALPLLDNDGKYVGTITEGDLLWKLKNTPGLQIEDTSAISIEDVHRYTNSKTVSINSNIDDLINLAKSQNFVPVVDDEGTFIGIIKRSDIINYCSDALFKCKGEKNRFKSIASDNHLSILGY